MLAMLRILHEIELTAGLMRNVARATRRLYPRELPPRIRGIIERMGAQASVQTHLAVDAFADSDEAVAAALPDMDDVMDDLQKELFRAIFAGFAGESTDEARTPDGGPARVRRPRLRAGRRPRGDDRAVGRVHGHRATSRRRRTRLARVAPGLPRLFRLRSCPVHSAGGREVNPPFLVSTPTQNPRSEGHHFDCNAAIPPLPAHGRRTGSTRPRPGRVRQQLQERCVGGSGSTTLNGSGSTFQKTFDQTAIAAFQDANTGITVNYAGGGSGKGKTDLQTKTVDFAGTDSLVKHADVAEVPGRQVPVLPDRRGADHGVVQRERRRHAPAQRRDARQDLLGLRSRSGTTLRSRPTTRRATLPSTDIVIVHRADGSGTTSNFTKYLAAAGGSAWTLGSGDTVDWPSSSQAGQGNAGVAQIDHEHRRCDRLRRLLRRDAGRS